LYNEKHSKAGDRTQLYDYIGGTPISFTPSASFETVKLQSYKDLSNNLITYTKILEKYKEKHPNPIDPSNNVIKDNNSALSNRDPNTYLKPRHDEIQKLRNDLDQKLMDLNNTSNGMYSSSKLQMDANIYITIMWTTLASAIVYYSFFHL